jgi:hypothetical protein
MIKEVLELPKTEIRKYTKRAREDALYINEILRSNLITDTDLVDLQQLALDMMGCGAVIEQLLESVKVKP